MMQRPDESVVHGSRAGQTAQPRDLPSVDRLLRESAAQALLFCKRTNQTAASRAMRRSMGVLLILLRALASEHDALFKRQRKVALYRTHAEVEAAGDLFLRVPLQLRHQERLPGFGRQ